ncbi:MAG TPA: NAD(+)/NADH kinase [Blastocatellia bacterium]|nr:NAD(+)/NADH kinase [Blastocatellia bacterium]
MTQFGIITKPNEPRAGVVAADIAQWAAAQGITLRVDERLQELPPHSVRATATEIVDCCDFLIVLGGDGTMIATARMVAGRGTPVIGVNLGWLGYLTEFAVGDVIRALECVVRGDFGLDHRTMLDWSLLRAQQEIETGLVLNDVVLNKSALARVIEINCCIGERYVTTYRGDGLIVATPTGSTAYNLSAGGPIIYPETEAICIAPICSHALTNRPIVLPLGKLEITLELITREEAMLTSDGQTGVPLAAGDLVKVKKSDKTFNMVRPKDRDYFQILRDKLDWSGSTRHNSG